MHERSLMLDLFRKIAAVSAEHANAPVCALTVRLGALSHFSPEHFREHFDLERPGTPAEDARLEIVTCEDTAAPHAQSVLLESLELEQRD